MCVRIYSHTSLMSLGAAHPLPNWRKNTSCSKYDAVWKPEERKKVRKWETGNMVGKRKILSNEKGKIKGHLPDTRLSLILAPFWNRSQYFDMQANLYRIICLLFPVLELFKNYWDCHFSHTGFCKMFGWRAKSSNVSFFKCCSIDDCTL